MAQLEESEMMTRWPQFARTKDWTNRMRVRDPIALLGGWLELLGQVEWELFVTLTFDPKRVFPVGSVTASKEAFRWCQDIERAFRHRVVWLIALERGASGQWHAHVLLADVPGDISPLAAIWSSRNGSVDVQAVRNLSGVILYATKEAAISGEILLSHSLEAYADRQFGRPQIALYPAVEGNRVTSGSNSRVKP